MPPNEVKAENINCLLSMILSLDYPHLFGLLLSFN